MQMISRRWKQPRREYYWLAHVNDTLLDKKACTVTGGTYTVAVPSPDAPTPGISLDGIYEWTTVTTSPDVSLPTGTVLMADPDKPGNVVPCKPGQPATGILFQQADTSAGDMPAVMIASRAVVISIELVWDAAFTSEADKLAALAPLRAAGVDFRMAQ